MSLFDLVDQPEIASWKIPDFPDLRGHNIVDVEMDAETNGLQWWEKDRPIGWAIGWEDQHDGRYHSRYFPLRHRTGQNIDPSAFQRWAHDHLPKTRVSNLNTRFDVHMAREDGIDFEALGMRVRDVAHSAALLDETRYRFSLEALVNDYLTDGEQKVKSVEGMTLDASRMDTYHPSVVAERAEADVRQVWKLRKHFQPLLEADDLMRVQDLEDQIIYVVCEMEKNGARIDLELLEQYIREVRTEIATMWKGIYDEIGVKVQIGSPKSMEELFRKLGLDIARTETGRASFTDLILKSHTHPIVQEVRRMAKLQSLEAKYLHKYPKALDSRGILRYALHQLRSVKQEGDEGDARGTVSGRFSSTEMLRGFGVNIQQVMKAAKQRVSFGYDEDDDSHDDDIFVIRNLHVPEPGQLWLSGDAMQIEYRLFAERLNDPKINAEYEADPYLSFHKMMHRNLKVHAPDLTYRRAKDTSFGKIYGAGAKKLALMLGFISQSQFEMLHRTKAPYQHPLLKEVREVLDIYRRVVPGADDVLKQAKEQAEKEGFVTTILGRRTRFKDGNRSHKAVNAIIQGTAADIMKQKLIEIHAARKVTGFLLRFTVHDEVDGDVPDVEAAKKVEDILNHQSFPLRIPILWDVATGRNWKECA